MQTPEFRKNSETLIELSSKDRIALMCAEALPWRYRRSLIADALLVRKIQVEHILGEKSKQIHTLTPWAVVNGTRITYPLESGQLNPETGKE